MATSYSTLRMSGKEYILVPKAEFKQWQRLTEEDRRAAHRAQQAIARFKAGKSMAVPLATVKRELGL